MWRRLVDERASVRRTPKRSAGSTAELAGRAWGLADMGSRRTRSAGVPKFKPASGSLPPTTSAGEIASTSPRVGIRDLARNAGLLTAALLASVSVGSVAAHAQTWSGPGSDWNTNTNWTPNTVPTSTAIFTGANPTTLTFSQLTTSIGTIQFNAGAAAYTLGVAGVTNSGVNYTLNVNGTGIINNSSNTQSFTVTSALTSSAALNFNNSSTAGNSHLSVNTGGFSTSSASINFNNTSSAGNATMQVFDGGFNLGFVFFNDSSTAANASIQLLGMGKVQFNGQSTAGNATELWAKVGDGVKG
jgi:hypothetical protein